MKLTGIVVLLCGLINNVEQVHGHAYLTNPLPRMYRHEGLPDGNPDAHWTNWMAIAGDELAPGEGNAPNMNANIPNAQRGIELESTIGHGLCGDRGDRRAFMKGGEYGPTTFRAGSYQTGSTMDVQVSVTAYHAGWFEFRLCDVSQTQNGEVTQECLNEHVLEIDSTTPYYPDILDYRNMKGRNPGGDGGVYKCQNTGGHFDETASSRNNYWPNGSCCQNGGVCSDPTDNKDRYIIEYAAGGNGMYDIVLKIPDDVACEHCVLQFYYQTANAWDNYPEAFWNCADITINSDPARPLPTRSPTAATVQEGSSAPTTGTAPIIPPTATPNQNECSCSVACNWLGDACEVKDCSAVGCTSVECDFCSNDVIDGEVVDIDDSVASSCTMPAGVPESPADVDNTGFANYHGKLTLNGVQLSNQFGDPVQLMGMSSHGLHWFPDCYSKESIAFQVEHWGINVFRAAMYIGENGFATDPSLKQKVQDIVQWCKELGIYAIIDWHVLTPGDPNYWIGESTADALEFWREMATLYRDETHVLYEIANEPNGVDWETVKRYHDTIIPAIREIDSETIIIAGTPTWSQDIHLAAANPVNDPYHVMYGFHFYAGTHMGLVSRVEQYMTEIPLFVSEWGTSQASGDGGPYLDEAKQFLDVFNGDVKLSWAQWSYSDKQEISAALNFASCQRAEWDSTSCSGSFVKNYIKSNVETVQNSPFTSSPTISQVQPRLTSSPTISQVQPLTPNPTSSLTPNPTNSPTIYDQPTPFPTNSPTLNPFLTTSPSVTPQIMQGCENVDEYSSSVIYRGLEHVVYQGQVYNAMWYAHNQIPTDGAPWEFVRFCDVQASACGNVPEWSSRATYTAGKRAHYMGDIYEAKWWSMEIPPPDTGSWNLVGSC